MWVLDMILEMKPAEGKCNHERGKRGVEEETRVMGHMRNEVREESMGPGCKGTRRSHRM